MKTKKTPKVNKITVKSKTGKVPGSMLVSMHKRMAMSRKNLAIKGLI